ncbi:MAG: class III poly(R)-hydroxyalkanoic acid synthase PhaE subunit [Gammaproteobacteria bacterium]|jgi:polyhydroxyalkanoate synthase subunit PhaE
MNDKMQFPFWDTDWMNSSGQRSQPDWFQNQKQYMDAWSSFQQFMPDSSSGINPMYKAMNSWWNDASSSMTGQNQDFYSKMMQQGKSFYFMGEQFNKLLEGLKELNSESDDWQKVLNDSFESMKSVLEGANASMQGSFTASPFMKGSFDSDHLKISGMTSFIDKLLSVPGFGPDRETQAQMQDGIKLFKEYQQASNEYNAQISKVGVEALEDMRLRILKMSEQGKEINSLREIYDLWVDCNEEAYAKLVYTDEYSELYGRLTNALLAVKQHNGKLMDKILTKLNMPTRQGMNTVLKRVQEMKRDQSKSTVKITSLENEIQALRQLIEGKKKPSSPTKSKSTVTKKKAKKKLAKKTVAKKVPNKASKKKSKKAAKKTIKKTAKKSSSNKTIVIDI